MKSLIYYFTILLVVNIQSRSQSFIHEMGDYTIMSGAGIVLLGGCLMGTDSMWVRYQYKKHHKLSGQPCLQLYWIPACNKHLSNLVDSRGLRERDRQRRSRWKKIIGLGVGIGIIGGSCLAADKILDQVFDV